jgi:DNA-binding MarR family transcriptional regulator
VSTNDDNAPVPFSPDPALDLTPEADQILRALRRITQSITIQSKQLYRQSGLTVPQLLSLRAISAARSVNVTAAEISRQVRLSPATVTGIIDRLERYGLVQRERLVHDRRKVGLRLTPEGRQRLATMPRPLQERFVRGLNDLGEPDRHSLLRALQQVVDMLEATTLDVSPILTTGDVNKSKPEL